MKGGSLAPYILDYMVLGDREMEEKNGNVAVFDSSLIDDYGRCYFFLVDVCKIGSCLACEIFKEWRDSKK